MEDKAVGPKLSTEKKNYFILLAALLAIMTYFHAFVRTLVDSPFHDFGNCWLNARLLKEGRNAWERDEATQERALSLSKKHGFVWFGPPRHYSPGFFVFLFPFAFLTFRGGSFTLACFQFLPPANF